MLQQRVVVRDVALLLDQPRGVVRDVALLLDQPRGVVRGWSWQRPDAPCLECGACSKLLENF